MASHDDKVAGMIRNLPAKTGRSLEDWIALVRSEGPDNPAEQRTWLKAEHGLGHFQARLIVGRLAEEA